MPFRITVSLLCLALLTPAAYADELPGVFRRGSSLPLEQVYTRVYEALEAHKFWVVFEADMGSRMEKMKAHWGDDYNRQHLDGVRSMVFCNIDWTHRIANADPNLLALCPLHLSVYTRNGQSVVVMPRPSAFAVGSPGAAEAKALEAELAGLIDTALVQ